MTTREPPVGALAALVVCFLVAALNLAFWAACLPGLVSFPV
jgi:hypothetical protein